MVKEKKGVMNKILFATSEAVPYIKTGGLADVVGSLPRFFDKKHYDVRIILMVINHIICYMRMLKNLHSFRKQY